MLLTAGKDQSLWLYDWDTDKPPRKGPGPDTFHCTAFSADGQRVATAAGGSGQVVVWDVSSGKAMKTLKSAYGSAVRNIYFLPNGRLLAAYYWGALYCWDIDSETLVYQFSNSTGVAGAALLPGGATVAVADRTTVRLLDTATGKEILAAAPYPGSVSCVVFCPDGKHLLAGSLAPVWSVGAVRLWDLQMMREVNRVYPGGSVYSIAVTADSQRAVAMGNQMLAWDLASRKILFHRTGWSWGLVRFAAGDKWLLATRPVDWGDVAILNAQTGEESKSFKGHKSKRPCDLDVFADGRQAVSTSEVHTSSQPGDICFWDVPSGEVKKSWPFPTKAFSTLRLSPDGRYLYAGKEGEESLWIWDLNKDDPTSGLSVPGHKAQMHSMAISPDGRTLVTCAPTGEPSVIQWDVPAGNKRQEWKIAGINATGLRQILAFAPDGRHVAVGRSDGRILILRLKEADTKTP